VPIWCISAYLNGSADAIQDPKSALGASMERDAREAKSNTELICLAQTFCPGAAITSSHNAGAIWAESRILRKRLLWWFLKAGVVLLLAAGGPGGATAETAEEVEKRCEQIDRLYDDGKYAEAVEAAMKAAALAETVGEGTSRHARLR
jgi:hypothetical protein